MRFFKNDFRWWMIRRANKNYILDYSVLSIAAQEGNEAIFEFLLENGADVNLENKYGSTALHATAEYFTSTQIARYLIDKGVDVDKQDYRGVTALHQAVSASNLDLVQFILEHGADVSLTTTKAETALDWLFLYAADMEKSD